MRNLRGNFMKSATVGGSLDTRFQSTVMVGEGRPSTVFFCFCLQRKEKTRGWSAFADHDDLSERV